MNEREISSIALINMLLSVTLVSATIRLMLDTKSIIFLIEQGVLKSVDSSLYSIRVGINDDMFYLTNIPLLLALAGLLLNIYVLVKNNLKKRSGK